MFNIKIKYKTKYYYLNSPLITIDDNTSTVTINLCKDFKDRIKYINNYKTSDITINGKAVVNKPYTIRLVGYY